MTDNPRQKRSKKKGKPTPFWQGMLPWLLLVLAFAMLGYAYMLETRPVSATLQKVQESQMAERTPQFGSETREMMNRSPQFMTPLPQSADSAVQRSLSGGAVPQTVNGASSGAVRELLNTTTAPDSTQNTANTARLCDLYRVSRCEN